MNGFTSAVQAICAGSSSRSLAAFRAAQHPIGGDSYWASTAEVNFPVYENFLRGVVFVDAGTVEKDITLGSIRARFWRGDPREFAVLLDAHTRGDRLWISSA